VDTGMGPAHRGGHAGRTFELDIDLFRTDPAAGQLAGTSVLTSNSLRVIAESHPATLLVVDGVLPSNEAAVRAAAASSARASHGYQLGIQTFFSTSCAVLEAEMGARTRSSRAAAHKRARAATGESASRRRSPTHGVPRAPSQPARRKVIDGDTVQAVRY